METNIKIKYNKLENISFNDDGYIDLNNTTIKEKQDLVDMCNIFRNPRYETFRIFYIKNDMIIGQEAITSRIPNMVNVYKGKTPIVWFEKMKNRMSRLNADGYYLAHNHASESAKPSNEDMLMTEKIAKNVEGFLGHIVLGNTDRFSIIEMNSNGKLLKPKEQSINDLNIDFKKSDFEEITLYDLKINNRENLVYILKQMQNNNEYSTAILTDAQCKIRMILDIPNKMFNQNEANLNGFFKNIAKNTGSTRVFIGTQNIQTYYKIINHTKYGTIKDSVYFKENNEYYMSEKIKDTPDLFEIKKKKIQHKDRNAR